MRFFDRPGLRQLVMRSSIPLGFLPSTAPLTDWLMGSHTPRLVLALRRIMSSSSLLVIRTPFGTRLRRTEIWIDTGSPLLLPLIRSLRVCTRRRATRFLPLN